MISYDLRYKGFWAEFAAARMFAQLVLLGAVSCWFRPHHRLDGSARYFDELPILLRAGAIGLALLHALSFGRFAVRNALLSLRNIEYSDEELARIFTQWRRQEALAQSVLDANLMLVHQMQTQLKAPADKDRQVGEPPAASTGLISGLSFLLSSRRALRMHDE